MWWRIIYGSLRLILGFTLLKIIGTPVSDIFYTLMEHEIIEDPNDLLIQITNPFIQHLPFTITYFLAGYLIFWGIMDIFLSINLLKHRLWAFSVSIYIIGIFVLYEIYRFSYTHSYILAGVILVDLIIIWLIKKEYDNLRSLSSKGALLEE